MDFGKFKYESAQKDREARRNQSNVVIKEMKLRPKIDDHDYETKKGNVTRFLQAGDKVKVTIMFRGRQQTAPNLYFLCCSAWPRLTESGFVESSPKQDGRNIMMVLGPHKKKAEAKVEQKVARETKAAEPARLRSRGARRAHCAQRWATGRPKEGTRTVQKRWILRLRRERRVATRTTD